MENGVFLRPKIAELLTNDYVEARLHADGDAHIERIQELQNKLVGNPALPQYVLIDPNGERVLGKFAGATFEDVRVAQLAALLSSNDDLSRPSLAIVLGESDEQFLTPYLAIRDKNQPSASQSKQVAR